MDITKTVPPAQAPAKPPSRAGRILTVAETYKLTPNMIRVTFQGEALEGFPQRQEGAHCKILLPEDGQRFDDFARQLDGGPRPTTRTYTVRHFREDKLELDIDFVAHGDEGPASRWAASAGPGSFCGFRGPGSVKMTEFVADWYLLAADMSALPVAAATLEAMPKDAVGTAVFEITDEADKQFIDAPEGIEIHWVLHPDPHKPSAAQETFLRGLKWPEGRVQTCVAGESSAIKGLRNLLHVEKNLPRPDAYISGYWKIGLVEDEHQQVKRAEAA
ncbi:MAG: siderophore-interacting protein [Pseudomonadota bacterium]